MFDWNQYCNRFKNVGYDKRRINYLSYLKRDLQIDHITKKYLKDVEIAYPCTAYRGYHLNHTVTLTPREKILYNANQFHQMYGDSVYDILRNMID